MARHAEQAVALVAVVKADDLGETWAVSGGATVPLAVKEKRLESPKFST